MNHIYLAHGGKEVVVGGKVTFLEGASLSGGIVEPVADSKATTVNALRADYNALLAALRAAGVLREEIPTPDAEAAVSGADEPTEAPAEPGDAE